jgi:hypothetical protein
VTGLEPIGETVQWTVEFSLFSRATSPVAFAKGEAGASKSAASPVTPTTQRVPRKWGFLRGCCTGCRGFEAATSEVVGEDCLWQSARECYDASYACSRELPGSRHVTEPCHPDQE